MTLEFIRKRNGRIAEKGRGSIIILKERLGLSL